MDLGLTSNILSLTHTNTYTHVHTQATRGKNQVVLKIHARWLRREAGLFFLTPPTFGIFMAHPES